MMIIKMVIVMMVFMTMIFMVTVAAACLFEAKTLGNEDKEDDLS